MDFLKAIGSKKRKISPACCWQIRAYFLSSKTQLEVIMCIGIVCLGDSIFKLGDLFLSNILPYSYVWTQENFE